MGYVQSVFKGLTRFSSGRYVTTIPRSVGLAFADQPREMFEILRTYYDGNGVYDALYGMLMAIGQAGEALKALRNPANRVVEFYPAKLWPGMLPNALPIETENERIIAPIHQVWAWSNWGTQKQIFARWQALYGNVFLKVAAEDGRVWFQLIDPRYVPTFDVDSRGIVTRAQFDIPINGEETFTELWTLEDLCIWVHRQGYGANVAELGPAQTVTPLAEMGIDFIPIVHVKHRDIGDRLGAGAFQLSLDKIDEANRQASRLYRMLFRHNKNTWVLRANQIDATGRPVPAPKINTDGSNALELDDDSVIRLPGNSELQSMVPPINYADGLAILADFLSELEQDLPEMAYYRIYESRGDLSGRALRLMLTAAVDRVIEARGNAETGLARADAMALTLGQGMGLWRGIGSYDAGDFAHTFADRPVIPLTESERAEIVRGYAQAGMPLSSALRLAGYSTDAIAQVEADVAAARDAEQVSLAQALVRSQREFDQQ